MKETYEIVPVIHPLLPIRTKNATNLLMDVTAPAHAHRDVELMAVLAGEMTFSFGGERVRVCKGDMIFVNSMVVHATKDLSHEETRFFILQFDPATVYNSDLFSEYKYLTAFLTHSALPYHLFHGSEPEKTGEMARVLQEIQAESEKKEPAYELFIKSSLYKILGLLYRSGILDFDSSAAIEQKSVLLERLGKLFAYVEQNYDQDVTVEMACGLLNLNYHYFCRLFKAATGKTFIQYLNFVRVSEAEKLLINTTQSIKSIVCQTGFSSMSYFNRAFKAIKGCSPSQYRLQGARQV